jgi:hypothetical protein
VTWTDPVKRSRDLWRSPEADLLGRASLLLDSHGCRPDFKNPRGQAHSIFLGSGSNLGRLSGLPQHPPKIEFERSGNPQERIKRRHSHAPFHEGNGLLGQSGAPRHLVHGQPETFPPFAQKAGGLLADPDSGLIVQRTSTMAKKVLNCLLTKVRRL